jgi:hypothetical protein
MEIPNSNWPSIGVCYQVSVHLAKRSRRRFIRNQPIRNKNCLWQPYLLTDRDKISNLYRGPSIDASYQVSVHFAQWFHKRRFLEISQSEKKNCLWWPCSLTDQGKMCNLYRGPSIDASYWVSVHLAKRFQRRRFFLIAQSETRIACGGHVCTRIGTKCAVFIEDLP